MNHDVCNQLLSNFPSKDQIDLSKYQPAENKVNYNPTSVDIETDLENCLNYFNSHKVLSFLEKLTGIIGLLSDPTFIGGGLHETFDGGKLGIHVD